MTVRTVGGARSAAVRVSKSESWRNIWLYSRVPKPLLVFLFSSFVQHEQATNNRFLGILFARTHKSTQTEGVFSCV
jgi:hypothetical protein